MSTTNARKPFFYDITLRDGNQSLKKPWNLKEKEIIFQSLVDLGVQAVEVGFPASSDMDFQACKHLAKIAPSTMVISGLARTVENDIIRVAEAVKPAKLQRIHTFITLSPFHMQYVLNKDPKTVAKLAIDAVAFAKNKIGKGEVEFSVEHFGDCGENLDFVIDTLKEIVKAGATTINLPNTVERTRPKTFINMIKRVCNELPAEINISVHNHNDLGMATATTVESYFAGAIQLECCLNGLGERAGNTNMQEVAVVLHNSGVDVPLNLSKIYETSLIVAEMSKTPIYEKAPLLGPDALAHRSGIHQDGAAKTKDMEKGAYRPIHPSLIGRKDGEELGFTSQSGKTAIFEIITNAGYPITMQEAIRLTPSVKEAAEKIGELPVRNIVDIYIKEVFKITGKFKLLEFKPIDECSCSLKFCFESKEFTHTGVGNGPVDCCLDALKQAGFSQKLVHYEQFALDEELLGSSANAMSVIHFENKEGKTIIARAMDENTAKANVKAIFNCLNLMYR